MQRIPLGPVVACLVLSAAAIGCGGRTPPPPADPVEARAALKAALDAWQAGTPPQSLRQRKPAIHVADEDWLAGRRLAGYRLADEGRMLGLTLRCPVVLELQNDRGQIVRRNVTYAVGTNPVLSVVRED
jgi:hypothetical protein